MRHWKTLPILAAVAATVLIVVAVAHAATPGGAVKSGPRAGRGACGALMSNPKALKEMQALRADRLKDMQAWRDKYGADSGSAEAQQALRGLREEHRNDMRALLQKYGIDASRGGYGMMGAGGCGGPGSGGCPGAGAGTGTGTGYGMMGGGGGMMGTY